MIELVAMALQIIIAVVIFAVWIFRPNLQTNYRGLPKWSVYAC